ncbi:MAG: hypothetical protein GWN29_04975 [Gammaproteobacteria bacterium]|nr:hypothetical protein [Gammaproteobacteria bacterium]
MNENTRMLLGLALLAASACETNPRAVAAMVESVRCVWSERYAACFCARSELAGFLTWAPEHVCKRELRRAPPPG